MVFNYILRKNKLRVLSRRRNKQAAQYDDQATSSSGSDMQSDSCIDRSGLTCASSPDLSIISPEDILSSSIHSDSETTFVDHGDDSALNSGDESSDHQRTIFQPSLPSGNRWSSRTSAKPIRDALCRSGSVFSIDASIRIMDMKMDGETTSQVLSVFVCCNSLFRSNNVCPCRFRCYCRFRSVSVCCCVFQCIPVVFCLFKYVYVGYVCFCLFLGVSVCVCISVYVNLMEYLLLITYCTYRRISPDFWHLTNGN